MIPNISKTKAMYISASHNNKKLTEHIATNYIKMENGTLAYCSEEKLLGVKVDNNLNWREQVEYTMKKCNTNLYLLLRIKSFLNLDSRKLFFNAYILPHIDYCCTIWGNCSQQLLDRVLKFQKRAARIILDKDYNEPSYNLFKELRWMTFSDRIEYKKAILIFKSLNEICPSYFHSKIYIHTCYTNELISTLLVLKIE